MLVPLERDGDQRFSALAAHAGVDVSVASQPLAVLERRRLRAAAGPTRGRAGQPDQAHPRRRPGPRAARELRAEWALTALAGWDEADARHLGDLLDRLVADLATAGARPPRSAVPTPR